MDSKAVISVQFNWMLVLIIGGLILIFFVGIVQKQRTISSENIAEAIQLDLQSIFSSSHISTETSSIIEIPKTEIKFSNEGFKVGNQFPAKFLYAFAPDLLKSDRNTISVFAYDWSVPYRITNFLYVTSPDIKYVINQNINQEMKDALEQLLPPRYITKDGKQKLFMNREEGSIDLLNDTNNYKVRTVSISSSCSGSNIPNVPGTNKKDVSTLCIDIDDGCNSLSAEEQLDCFGDLYFANYNNNGVPISSQSQFIGRASLIAAIFSENKEIYEYGMNNAINRLKNISFIYDEKAKSLQNYYQAIDINCANLFDQASQSIQNIKTIVDITAIQDIIPFYGYIQDLKQINEQLLINSCPAIY